jgi:hypothetical protein
VFNLPPNSGVNEATRVTLASIVVPTGQYIVTVTAYAQDLTNGFVNNTLQCTVRQDGSGIDSTINSFAHSSAIQQLTYPTSATVTAASSALSLACGTSDGGGQGTAVASGRIQAIKVGSLQF